MTIFRQLPVLFVLGVAIVTPIHAAESVTGRWALDAEACTRWFGPAAQVPLIVSETALRWSEDACRIERMYKTGDTVHIQALCWNANGERSIPVSLRPHAGKLEVRWDRVRSGDLKRCQ